MPEQHPHMRLPLTSQAFACVFAPTALGIRSVHACGHAKLLRKEERFIQK